MVQLIYATTDRCLTSSDGDESAVADLNDVVPRDGLGVLLVGVADQGPDSAPRRQDVTSSNCTTEEGDEGDEGDEGVRKGGKVQISSKVMHSETRLYWSPWGQHFWLLYAGVCFSSLGHKNSLKKQKPCTKWLTPSINPHI